MCSILFQSHFPLHNLLALPSFFLSLSFCCKHGLATSHRQAQSIPFPNTLSTVSKGDTYKGIVTTSSNFPISPPPPKNNPFSYSFYHFSSNFANQPAMLFLYPATKQWKLAPFVSTEHGVCRFAVTAKNRNLDSVGVLRDRHDVKHNCTFSTWELQSFKCPNPSLFILITFYFIF